METQKKYKVKERVRGIAEMRMARISLMKTITVEPWCSENQKQDKYRENSQWPTVVKVWKNKDKEKLKAATGDGENSKYKGKCIRRIIEFSPKTLHWWEDKQNL